MNNCLFKYLLPRRLQFLSAAWLIFWAGGGAVQAAKLDPGAWQIYSLNTTNILTKLTDNNPATFVTLTNASGFPNSIGLIIDLGQTNIIDRVFLIGGNATNLNIWSNSVPETNPPLGLIAVSVGNNPASMTNQVGTWTVPPNAGNPVNTEVDLRFSPTAGRYVQIQLKTNVIWGVNYWPGWALSSQPPAPTNLTWNVGEVELYGFGGLVTNLNAVVCDGYTNQLDRVNSVSQPLQIAALDLS